MEDLHIPPAPGAPNGLVVPAGELIERFTHASGPGGQGVNTADSRVQLSLDLGATTALTNLQRRSEERRVGKECRSRRAEYQKHKKDKTTADRRDHKHSSQ